MRTFGTELTNLQGTRGPTGVSREQMGRYDGMIRDVKMSEQNNQPQTNV